MTAEVTQPILVSPYDEPDKHWYIQAGETPRQVEGRRPSFIIRSAVGDGGEFLNTILETKGYDPLREVKEAAAVRWANAVNADGRFGRWRFRMASSVADVSYILDEADAPDRQTLVSDQIAELHNP